MIVYLHGFNSTSASRKAVATVEYCRRIGIECVAPDLPHRPAEAIELASRLCGKAEHAVAVGSSLGGYFATWLVEQGHAQAGVLINPAVAVADKLRGEIGKEQQIYSSEARYLYTEDHVRELRELEVERPADPGRYLLLVQEGDETLDCREAIEFYSGARQVVEPGGDHSFVGYERHLPEIARLALAGGAGSPLD